MPDIVVMALPADRARADCILDGLSGLTAKTSSLPRLVIAHPNDQGWRQAVQEAESGRCVVLCWSHATQHADAQPMAAFGQQLLVAGTAISVELDERSLPPELLGCTTYPLHGFRCWRDPLSRFVFGDSYVSQIVAAAQEKAMGRDPPSPVTLSRMVWVRAGVLVFSLVTILSLVFNILQVGELPFVAKAMDPKAAAAFNAAKASKAPCSALRAFSKANTGSPFADEAMELLGTCHMVTVTEDLPDTKQLPVYGATRAEAEGAAEDQCKALAGNMRAQLVSSKITQLDAAGAGMAECQFIVPTAGQREVMGEATSPDRGGQEH